MNLQPSHRAFNAFSAFTRPAAASLSRYAPNVAATTRSHPQSASLSTFRPSLPSLPSQTSTPALASTNGDVHVCKKRRYSYHAAAFSTSSDRPGRRDTKNTEDESASSVIVTSSKRSLRDQDGRPWAAESQQDNHAFPRGGASREVYGVGVSLPPTAFNNRKKSRSELRDLAGKPHKKFEQWQIQKAALNRKFGDDGWQPRKKVSPDAMEGIRALHEQDPERWSTPVLADHFKISPEAIRRILKSKWRPKNAEEVQARRERWARRHDRIWDHHSELGLRPERESDKAVEDPDRFEKDLMAKEILDNARRA